MLLLVACANIGSPDGGPYDETPPKIVSTSPKFGETSSNATKVVIEFDEIVKIDNPQEKVVISPPQIEQPEIEANGKKITVTLLDSLIPGQTYTIDFADAIADNNEGNPLGDYAFTFSTGENIDTMQVSGHVLDASNLEPIKGMMVGLYKVADGDDEPKELADSTFRTIPFERISRTDSRGHFVVKGLASGKYRAFALNDQNQNYVYDQRSEMVAFSDRILRTSSKPDVRMDTLWHDSIHYISIDTIPYTHFYPDDIVLKAFSSAVQDQYRLKEERPIPQHFTLYFTAASDSLPRITGLNFDATDAFIIDASAHNDTINYWIRDSLVYNIDTLTFQMDYMGTDTTGVLVLKTDTLELTSKLTRAKIEKQNQEKFEEWAKEYRKQWKMEQKLAAKRKNNEGEEQGADGEESSEATDENKEDVAVREDSILADVTQTNETSTNDDEDEDDDEEVVEIQQDKDKKEKGKEQNGSKKKKKKKVEDEDIEIPPVPEEFLEYKISNAQGLDPDKNIDFVFNEPLDSFDISKIHFSMKVDTIFQPAKFLFKQLPGKSMSYRLYAEWEPDSTYKLEIDTAAFVNIYGKRCEAQMRTIKVKSLDSYSTLFISLHGADTTAVIQLLDGSDKVVKQQKAPNGKADFYFLNPGAYYMRVFYDRNGNGVWDTGDYDKKLQPEEVYYYPSDLQLKAMWELSQDWSPEETPLPKQKPIKITKQKPDKEKKTTRSRNAEREANKRKK